MDIAFIGGGWIASHVLEGVVAHGSELVAVADPDPQRRRHWQGQGVAVYPNHQALLEACTAEVVAVLTPTDGHPQPTIDALAAGRHVVVEKPMAASVAEGAAMVAAAGVADRRLLVEESYLHAPTHRLARSMVADGAVGRPRSVVMTFYGWRALPPFREAVAAANAGWRSQSRFPWLTDHLPHVLAWARALAGGAPLKDLHPLGGPAEAAVRGFTGRSRDVEIVWVRATQGDEGVLGRRTGLHTQVVGSAGYLEVLGEGGSWGDEGPAAGIRRSTGSVVAAVDEEPDVLWSADVGYYPVAHRRCMLEALRAIEGAGTDAYDGATALDDLEAMFGLFDRIEPAHSGAAR